MNNERKRARWRELKQKGAEAAMQGCPIRFIGPRRGTFDRKGVMRRKCNASCPAYENCMEEFGIPKKCPGSKKPKTEAQIAACVLCKLVDGKCKLDCPHMRDKK